MVHAGQLNSASFQNLSAGLLESVIIKGGRPLSVGDTVNVHEMVPDKRFLDGYGYSGRYIVAEIVAVFGSNKTSVRKVSEPKVLPPLC